MKEHCSWCGTLCLESELEPFTSLCPACVTADTWPTTTPFKGGQMKECRACLEKNIIDVSAKCSDLFNASQRTEHGVVAHEGYVPQELGIGRGDYVAFSYCGSCGAIQNGFPKTPKVDLKKIVDAAEARRR